MHPTDSWHVALSQHQSAGILVQSCRLHYSVYYGRCVVVGRGAALQQTHLVANCYTQQTTVLQQVRVPVGTVSFCAAGSLVVSHQPQHSPPRLSAPPLNHKKFTAACQAQMETATDRALSRRT